MATTTAPPRLVPRVVDVHQPRWLERMPTWASSGGFLVALMAVSAYLRTRYIGGQFWMDEAITTGISSHPLSQIPGLLRHDGSPPLFYVLLHFWIKAFGASETATHALPVTFGVLTVPIAMWAGWSLFGRRAGWMAATLFAFSPFLTTYAQETRMYELMALLGLVATAAYLHGFVYRRRKYLILFSVALAAMLYTHAWGAFYAVGCVIGLIPVYLNLNRTDRRRLVKDAVFTFVGAGVLFLPWVPNFTYQASHTGAPWAPSPRFGVPVQISRDLLGGDRVTAALTLASAIGLAALFTRRYRRSRDAITLWALILVPFATLLLAWIASQITPAFVSRYFSPVLASVLLLAAFGCSRAGIVGLIAIVLSVIFTYNIANYTPQYKSDMRNVGGEVSPYLHQGDLVLVGQPEQTPLSWYYLRPGLKFATVLGPVSDPTYMNWVYALKRLRKSNAQQTLTPLLASLKPGQQILFVRPLTEGAGNWRASWTQLVRRRSAQMGAILASDPELRRVAWAPRNYRGACCVADSAVLYQKVS